MSVTLFITREIPDANRATAIRHFEAMAEGDGIGTCRGEDQRVHARVHRNVDGWEVETDDGFLWANAAHTESTFLTAGAAYDALQAYWQEEHPE